MTTADSSDPHTLLMDAAERLIIERGYDAISTRVVAAEAGVNHGLVHYYFGSVSNLLVATLDRFTERTLKRQRALYAEDRPFIEKWRDAMGYLRGDDPESGYSKLWMEMQAMSWNHPEILEHVQDTALKWRALLTDAFSDAMTDYGDDVQRRSPTRTARWNHRRTQRTPCDDRSHACRIRGRQGLMNGVHV
jgi:AcrR family transcriptional regulator